MRAMALAGLVAGGLLIFAFLAQILGAAGWQDFKGMLKRPANPPGDA
jgi:hypothetical protein